MIAPLRPYPEYKTSGVAWLGQVPVGWDPAPARDLFREVVDRNHPDEEMLSVTIATGVVRQAELLETTSGKDSSNPDRSSYKLVTAGDLAYNKMRAWQGAIDVSRHRGIVSPAYIVVRSRGNVAPQYAHRLMRTPAFAKEAERWSYGITSDQWSLRPKDFKQIYFCVPPAEEQDAIVRYLDHVDSRIQRLISAKERLIELLEEEKQEIVYRAVTRGLDPDAALRPSGIDWTSEIPAQWNVVRLRATAGRVRGGVWGKDPDGNHDTACVRVADFDRSTAVVGDGSLTLRCFSASERRGRLLRRGDLLLEKSGGGDQQPVGFVVRFERTDGAIYSNFIARLPVRPPHDPRYLTHLHRCLYARRVNVRSIKQTTGIQNLDVAAYLREPVPVPPENEQVEIADFLDERLTGADRTVAAARRQMHLLREYRTRLVSDVVTGKLDVREAATKLDDDPEAGAPELDQAIEEVAT